MVGQATITPPEDAKVCTSELIQITSWTPRGDTLINVGGAVVQVDLRRPTAIDLKTDTGRCDDKDLEELIEEAKKQGKEPDLEHDPTALRTDDGPGCLDPPQAGVEVILKYVDPLGNVDLPHGHDRCERLLRGLRGQRHRRHLAGHRGVPRRQVRGPGHRGPDHRVLVPQLSREVRGGRRPPYTVTTFPLASPSLAVVPTRVVDS